MTYLKETKNYHLRAPELKEQTILWTDTPKPGFSITLLEGNGYNDALSGANIFGWIVGCFLSGAIMAFHFSNLYLTLLVVFLGILLLVLPDILKAERKRKTKYYLTEEEVIFELWQARKRLIKRVALNNIDKIYIDVHQNGRGSLYLVLKTEVDFTTLDFEKSAPMHHPTLIMVDNVRTVADLLRKTLKNKNKDITD